MSVLKKGLGAQALRALRCDVALAEVMTGIESMCEHSRRLPLVDHG